MLVVQTRVDFELEEILARVILVFGLIKLQKIIHQFHSAWHILLDINEISYFHIDVGQDHARAAGTDFKIKVWENATAARRFATEYCAPYGVWRPKFALKLSKNILKIGKQWPQSLQALTVNDLSQLAGHSFGIISDCSIDAIMQFHAGISALRKDKHMFHASDTAFFYWHVS